MGHGLFIPYANAEKKALYMHIQPIHCMTEASTTSTVSLDESTFLAIIVSTLTRNA